MNFDESLEKLKNFDWNDLGDPENIGSWPGPVKAIIYAIFFTGILVAGYQYDIKEKQEALARVQASEVELRATYERKAFKAANLDAYKAQLAEMEEKFTLLRSQLPSETEVPGLLEDISHIGLGSGLEFRSITLQPEAAKPFYVELPIVITVFGSYHDLGSFVSGISSLPRIVTLHDFSMTPSDKYPLAMTITAKTYRYRESDESS